MPLTNRNLLTTPLPHQMNERPVTANAARKQTGCFPSHSGHSRNSIDFENADAFSPPFLCGKRAMGRGHVGHTTIDPKYMIHIPNVYSQYGVE
jgi:hypothetical protein